MSATATKPVPAADLEKKVAALKGWPLYARTSEKCHHPWVVESAHARDGVLRVVFRSLHDAQQVACALGSPAFADFQRLVPEAI
jgi:hypothetical protein